MKCLTTNEIIREFRGALGKNDIFPHCDPIRPPIHIRFGHYLHMKLCFWNEEDFSKLLLKRNLQGFIN